MLNPFIPFNGFLSFKSPNWRHQSCAENGGWQKLPSFHLHRHRPRWSHWPYALLRHPRGHACCISSRSYFDWQERNNTTFRHRLQPKKSKVCQRDWREKKVRVKFIDVLIGQSSILRRRLEDFDYSGADSVCDSGMKASVHHDLCVIMYQSDVRLLWVSLS